MLAQLQKVGEKLTVEVTPQVAREMGLGDGDWIEYHKTQPEVRYATVEEALRAYDETLPDHEAAYRELAK